MTIAASELIINKRGAVYHLNLRPEELAATVITVGDPERVKEVSRYFDRLVFTTAHREFVVHTGYIGNKQLSVIATGIGTDNIDIVLSEIDALVNIDFTTREIKQELTRLQIIRLGTCGGLQEDIPTDALIVSSSALGMDNLLYFYQHRSTAEETALLDAFRSHLQWGAQDPAIYVTAGSEQLAARFREGYHHGITVTCPGFYAPQGRMLRAAPAYERLLPDLAAFRYKGRRITGIDMETSGIYGLGKVFGHECLSIGTVVANRARGEFSRNIGKAVDNMISRSLEIIAAR